MTDTPNSPTDYRVLNAKFRDHLQSSEGRGWEHFDDVVFKIAAGGLALSITLLGVMKDSVVPASMWWVFTAWIFWSISLLLIMLSVRTAQQGLRSQIARWDAGNYYQPPLPEGKIGGLTPWLNDAALLAGAIGLIALIMFAYLNLH